MGPKKKSGGKEGGGGGKTNAPQAYKISRQLDQERIDFLAKRVEELLGGNNELRASSSRNEKDTHDIVLYFQREMEMKDDIITRLNEELVKRETQLKFEVEKMKKKFDEEKADLVQSTDYIIVDLTQRLGKAEADLAALVLFQEEKKQHEQKLKDLERKLTDQRQEMFDSLDEQERKYLEENATRMLELEQQKVAFREVALKEARDAMGQEAKKIIAENTRMYEELKFHNTMTNELQADKAALEKELVAHKRELTIVADKELEYAHQGFYKTKEIKALRERVEHLEQQQAANMERFKHKTKEIKATVHRELEEVTLDAAGLRRLLKIKNKELQHMKTLAATILSQRTETEQFFLESLHEVKELVKKERKRTVGDTKIVLNKLRSGSGTHGTGKSDKKPVVAFPPLNVKATNLHHLDARATSEIPLAANENISLKDMTWEDKELVLRVLFSKMNGVQANADTAIDQGIKGRHGAMPPVPGAGYSNNVFVSEGALMPPGEMDGFERNYEMLLRDNGEDELDELME
jgi:hypothetical protein